MSKYQDSILTSAGLLLASKAYAGKTTFTLTKTTTTADVVTIDQIKKLTELPNEIQSGTMAQSDTVVNDDHTLITAELLFTNEKLNAGYEINAIGIYAKEAGATDEILYSVTLAEKPEYMPSFADKVLLEFKTTITMAVGQINSVTIEMTPNNLATVQYVQNAIKGLATKTDLETGLSGKQNNLGYVPARDSAVVHDTKDGSITVNGQKIVPATKDDVTEGLAKKVTDSGSGVIMAGGTSYDLTKFQQQAITKPDGTAYLDVGDNDSLIAKLNTLPAGFFTIHIGINNTDVPSTSSAKYGVVYRNNYDSSAFRNNIFLTDTFGHHLSTVIYDDGSNSTWEGITYDGAFLPKSKTSGSGFFQTDTSFLKFKNVGKTAYVDCFADLATKPTSSGWLDLGKLPSDIYIDPFNKNTRYYFGFAGESASAIFKFDASTKMFSVMANTTNDVYRFTGTLMFWD